MEGRKLRVAVLTGADSPATCETITLVARLPQLQVVGILQESQAPSFRRLWRNLKKNMRRNGFYYCYWRLGQLIKDSLDRLAARLVPRAELAELLRQSLPDRISCLTELSQARHLPLEKFANLNDSKVANVLRKLEVDLGIVIGTRILKRSTFSVPRLGCLNLHKGKVPEYRGMPVGFWELYDRQSTAGVTVHFVDDGLDTGDVVEADVLAISPKDTPETLRKRLDRLGSEVMARCVAAIADGRGTSYPQPASQQKPRTSPSIRQRRELDRRLGCASAFTFPWAYVLKTSLYLVIYYSGLFHVVRAFRRLRRKSRACIVLYHRVNDLTEDALTTSIERFAEHMVVLRKYYRAISSSVLSEKVRSKEKLSPDCIAIHFDDCYRDVFANAFRILSQVSWPACCFVCSGFVGTDRMFSHDADCPFRLENLSVDELVELSKGGFEIGSHTVNHADLGRCSYQVAVTELEQSKRDLEKFLRKPVRLFSYPFGRQHNFRMELVEAVRQAGYQAIFSAYGGYVDKNTDVYDICSVAACSRYRSLDLLMEIEGLSLAALRKRWLTPANSHAKEGMLGFARPLATKDSGLTNVRN
jgi:folate-dependent phosphoribosylglycinamide formyltransferase PurN/peptidoglycan/xylan/chitin deacetylase (PgdA/CDA1 family)